MKRSNKILAMALALLMVIPMFAFTPLEVDAASAEGHKTFSSVLDFEEATPGVLTEEYVQGELARGFSATTSASDVAHSGLRALSNWTVAEEQKVTAQTAGADTADTSDDKFTYEAAVPDNAANNGKDNKNYVLRQTTPGQFPEFSIWDTTGVLLSQPFEFSFDIFPRSEQVAKGTAAGNNTGLISFSGGEIFGSRANLLTMANGNPTVIKDGLYGEVALGTLTLNQWVSVRIRAYPSTGRVITWINGKQVNDRVLSGLADLYNAGAHTKAAIAIGWNYGQTFDFDLDNISLCSIADTPDINEHIDFTDYRIDPTTGVKMQTLAENLAASLSANTEVRFGSKTNTDYMRDSFFSVVTEADGNQVLKHAVTEQKDHAGIRLGNTSLFGSVHEASLRIKYVGFSTSPLNTIRYGKDDTTGLFAPLVLMKGRSDGTLNTMYVGSNVNCWALLKQTAEGYVPATIEKNKWYDFKSVADPAAGTYQIFMKTEADTDWQLLRFIKDAPKTQAWLATTYTEEQTVDHGLFSWHGSSLTSANCVWFAHGTSNAWQANCEWYVDDIAIKTEDRTTVNELLDFELVDLNAKAQTLTEYLNANDAKFTTAISSGDYYSLKKDRGNWMMNQNIPQNMGATAGLNFKDKTNLNNTDTVTITFDFRKNVNTLANAYNTVRISGGTTMGPLTFAGGKYITTHADGYATFRKTDEGYVVNTMSRYVWYSFKLELDLANENMKLWMKTGTVDAPSTGEWEPVYYLTNGTADGVAGGALVMASKAINNTYSLADFENIMTTDADLKWYYGASANFGSDLQFWFLHGTNNAWTSGNDADMDNLSIVTADGGVDVTFDFTPEIETMPDLPANTDWWENDTFVNADSKKAGAKLSSWQVVDAPAEASTYGKVIQPKANIGAFCFNDTKDLLPSYIFDISFDMYMTQAPSSNVHLLKMWAPATGTAKVEISSLVLMGNTLYTYDEMYGKNDKRFPLNYTVSNKTWYNFRIRFDLLTGTYMVYVNGRLLHVQDWLAAYPEGKFSLSDLSNIHFEIHNHWGTSVLGYHFLDNIRVETVDEAVRNTEAFVDYEILAADFEDGDWVDKVKAGEIDNLSMNYSKASILEDAGVAGNHALLLTGTSGGAMDVDMMAMGGYHNTFSIEMSVSYGNPHGSALDLAILSDNNLSGDRTLLSVMGDHAKEELTGTFFFNDDGNRYYLCDYTGKYYHSDNGDAEAASFTDIAIIVDAESNSYAVYINQKPAYYKAHGEADTLTRATDIPLGVVSGKTALKSPMLSLVSCSSDKTTMNKVLVDDIRVASVKNGLTPMLVGYQENTASGTSIRFLATVDTLYYEEMGFIVEAKDVTKTVSTTTVFTSVTANGSEVVAKELDGRYITALVVSGIDESPVEFTVTPYAVYFGKEIRGQSQVITYTE